jgi:hypothetical protein
LLTSLTSLAGYLFIFIVRFLLDEINELYLHIRDLLISICFVQLFWIRLALCTFCFCTL